MVIMSRDFADKFCGEYGHHYQYGYCRTCGDPDPDSKGNKN